MELKKNMDREGEGAFLVLPHPWICQCNFSDMNCDFYILFFFLDNIEGNMNSLVVDLLTAVFIGISLVAFDSAS